MDYTNGKTMTQAEKARAYDEAWHKAKRIINVCVDDNTECRSMIACIQQIFPELEESEDDRIRKELIEHIKANCETGFLLFQKFSPDEIIAWLEKQGEQKIKQKFHEGDWIVNKLGDAWHIDSIDNRNYQTSDGKGNYNYFPISKQDEMRLWTIADAKDGDVLVNGSNIFIFHFLNDTRLMGYCHINIDDWRFYDDIGKNECFCLIDAIVTPATKEQRELLFAKIEEAGYEWDAEKKELKKIYNALEDCEIENIEHGKYYYCIKDYYAGGNKRASKGDVVQALRGMSMMALGVKANEYFIPVNAIKQEKSWSKEDEKNWRGVIDEIEANKSNAPDYDVKTYDRFLSWLRTLKQRLA